MVMMMIKLKKTKVLSLLLIAVSPLLLSACQKKPTKQELMASSELKVSQSKASSYSSYVAVQAKMPPIDMKAFRDTYNDLVQENNGINHNQSSGNYHNNVDGSLYHLQGLIKNKYATTGSIKEAYKNALDQIKGTKESTDKTITNLKQYRDNSIIKDVIKYYKMENELLKMNKIYARSIYKQDPDLDNSPGIELYKAQMDKLYRSIVKRMLPILQQANYEDQSAEYHSRKESQYNDQLSNDFSSDDNVSDDDSISASSSDQIANNGKNTAENELNKYNAQIPSDKGK